MTRKEVTLAAIRGGVVDRLSRTDDWILCMRAALGGRRPRELVGEMVAVELGVPGVPGVQASGPSLDRLHFFLLGALRPSWASASLSMNN
jgi:hypothetical protein